MGMRRVEAQIERLEAKIDFSMADHLKKLGSKLAKLDSREAWKATQKNVPIHRRIHVYNYSRLVKCKRRLAAYYRWYGGDFRAL